MQRSQILERINDCEKVLKELESSHVWKILTADLSMQMELIDSKWHMAKSEDTAALQELRVAKLAIIHVLSLHSIYEQHLENAQKALNEIDNVETEIAKDYDLETNIEKEESKGGDYGTG